MLFKLVLIHGFHLCKNHPNYQKKPYMPATLYELAIVQELATLPLGDYYSIQRMQIAAGSQQGTQSAIDVHRQHPSFCVALHHSSESCNALRG